MIWLTFKLSKFALIVKAQTNISFCSKNLFVHISISFLWVEMLDFINLFVCYLS
jgi:hypothetical protein